MNQNDQAYLLVVKFIQLNGAVYAPLWSRINQFRDRVVSILKNFHNTQEMLQGIHNRMYSQ